PSMGRTGLSRNQHKARAREYKRELLNLQKYEVMVVVIKSALPPVVPGYDEEQSIFAIDGNPVPFTDEPALIDHMYPPTRDLSEILFSRLHDEEDPCLQH